jgi:hypothetical protein
MSSGTLAGKRGLMGAFRFPKLCKKPTLTYDENTVEIDGKGFSGTIPVSSISAVLIETKRSLSLLIGAVIAMIISIIKIVSDFDDFDDFGNGLIFFVFPIVAIILWVKYFRKRTTGRLIGAIICSVFSFNVFATIKVSRISVDSVGSVVFVGVFFIIAIILLVIYFKTKKVAFSIISDGYAYTLSIKGNNETVGDLEKTKYELRKIVVAGRKAVN